jgi:hypothetical protein
MEAPERPLRGVDGPCRGLAISARDDRRIVVVSRVVALAGGSWPWSIAASAAVIMRIASYASSLVPFVSVARNRDGRKRSTAIALADAEWASMESGNQSGPAPAEVRQHNGI